ncbi:CGNR zinc finger domain-containing protein [Micromonospora sp. NIE79]|uniref:CGNR zinc finger domain-containing protein n=1 Tax=Micromonospora trifolii TaxID=2911208 RepID=A0ABS9NBG9_9ACTN|nr:CGNR zinc finger domain-containing protein [Micromonospora trifolii]MCG5447158.1 CGNR zinc finger domain-containing protein [Micromonospora trifolii]
MTPSMPERAAGAVAGPWIATARYGIDHAPGGLGLVQDLLNTISAGAPRHPDLLDDLGSAIEWARLAVGQWSTATGRPAPDVTLDAAGLRALRIFREELLDEIDARLHVTPDPGQPVGASNRVSTGSRTSGATLRLDSDGSVHLDPAGVGADLLVSLILAALFEAQLADVGRRIKTCRNPRCRVAFYDRSRNNSGVWHSVRACGHPTNLRAHRARQRQVD